jgi:prepilin peptidase CpaA
MLVWLLIHFVGFLALIGAAVVMDVRERRIPNVITVPALLFAVAIAAALPGRAVLPAIVGALVAFGLGFPLFALGGIGAGDAKLLTAVGAFVGPTALLAVIIWGGLAGCGLALADAVRRRTVVPLLMNTLSLFIYLISLGRAGRRASLETPGAQTVPYGVAIAAGALAAWFIPLPGTVL